MSNLPLFTTTLPLFIHVTLSLNNFQKEVTISGTISTNWICKNDCNRHTRFRENVVQNQKRN